MIYVTSDLHLCHDKEFLYVPRGFKSIDEMNNAIIDNWNSIVTPEDDVYVLGDLMLNNDEEGIRLISLLHGNIHIIRGNHDTDNRLKLYESIPSVVEIVDAKYFKYGKHHFYMTHFPCLCGNYTDEKFIGMMNLCGHIHTTDTIHQIENSIIYHCELDAHKCFPVSMDSIVNDIKSYIKEKKCLT